jgi:hypothetical protein
VTDEILLGAPPAIGPLDIVPGAIAAYGLRRLRKGYIGPLINLRRSSDNAQPDFYALPNGDLPVASIAGFIGAGSGLFTKLYDQSLAASRHVSQATAAQQPPIAFSSTPRLRPGIACASASNTFLTGTIPASTLPLSLSGVAKRTSNPQFGDYFNLGFNFPSLFFVASSANQGGLANIGVAGSLITTIADNSFHAMVGVFVNGTNGVLYVDSAAKVTTSGLSTSAGSTVIQFGGVTGSVLDGVITEAIYWAGTFTDAQAAALIANERAYYGF